MLDGKPRMITLALRPGFWVAYDTAHASLHRVWRGRVEFDSVGFVKYFANTAQFCSHGSAFSLGRMSREHQFDVQLLN